MDLWVCIINTTIYSALHIWIISDWYLINSKLILSPLLPFSFPISLSSHLTRSNSCSFSRKLRPNAPKVNTKVVWKFQNKAGGATKVLSFVSEFKKKNYIVCAVIWIHFLLVTENSESDSHIIIASIIFTIVHRHMAYRTTSKQTKAKELLECCGW